MSEQMMELPNWESTEFQRIVEVTTRERILDGGEGQ